MATSVFFIKGFSVAYWNLEQAIKEAKLCARSVILDAICREKDDQYSKRVTNNNIDECVLKYRVTEDKNGNIKVKAVASIPYDRSWSVNKKIKNATFSKTYTICALPIEEGKEDINFEFPFAKK